MKDYYNILGVSENAYSNEIKSAFRKLAKKYHPDRNRDDENALKMFHEVSEAYEVLNNESEREKYDNLRKKTNFNNKSSSSNENKKSKNATKNNSDFDKTDAINNLNKYFENFFGFKADSNDIDESKLKKKSNNPIDTSTIFDSFFNIKK